MHHVRDANDTEAFSTAVEAFRGESARPTLIVVDSVIGYGAPIKQGTAAAHGEPLLLRHEPVALVLSRQPLPTVDRSRYASAAGGSQGRVRPRRGPRGDP